MTDYSHKPPKADDTKRLLDGTPVIRGACELDLLVFFHRHPRTLLTNEQLAAFVGYGMKQVATVIEAFIDAGILERITQTSRHAARMYLLILNGPTGGDLRALLKLSSTTQGRLDILQRLGPDRSHTAPGDIAQETHRLHAIA